MELWNSFLIGNWFKQGCMELWNSFLIGNWFRQALPYHRFWRRNFQKLKQRTKSSAISHKTQVSSGNSKGSSGIWSHLAEDDFSSHNYTPGSVEWAKLGGFPLNEKQVPPTVKRRKRVVKKIIVRPSTTILPASWVFPEHQQITPTPVHSQCMIRSVECKRLDLIPKTSVYETLVVSGGPIGRA